MNALDLKKKVFVGLDRSATISELIGGLKAMHQKNAVIFDAGKYIGVTSRRYLLKTKLNVHQSKVYHVIKHVPVLTGSEDIKEVARLLFTADVHILPIMKDKRIVGIVDAHDVVNEIKKIKSLKNQKIKEIMIPKPISINEKDRFGKAIEIMREKGIDRLPVVDKKGEITGIFTFTDLIEKYLLQYQGKSEHRGRGGMTKKGKATIRSYKAESTDMVGIAIKEFTTKNILTGKVNDSVEKIIKLMDRCQSSSMILAENNKPVGIITHKDLLKLFLKGNVTY